MDEKPGKMKRKIVCGYNAIIYGGFIDRFELINDNVQVGWESHHIDYWVKNSETIFNKLEYDENQKIECREFLHFCLLKKKEREIDQGFACVVGA